VSPSVTSCDRCAVDFEITLSELSPSGNIHLHLGGSQVGVGRTFSAVPEPTTAMLVGAGLLLLRAVVLRRWPLPAPHSHRVD
jgi:hypothetical protein